MARPSVRGKLVEAALETFQQRGFNGSSVQDIVDEAGVPKGSFYNHFKTKESLALEVLGRYRALAPTELLKDVKKAPLKALRTYFEQLAKLNNQLAARAGARRVRITDFGDHRHRGLHDHVADRPVNEIDYRRLSGYQSSCRQNHERRDSFHPRWSATIDGTPAAIVRADAIWRGVVVHKGSHEVFFRCRAAAPWWTWLLLLAGASGTVMLAAPRGLRRMKAR